MNNGSRRFAFGPRVPIDVHGGSGEAMTGQTIRTPDQAEGRTGEAPTNRPDAATTVVITMRQLGVAGLPRNYELFYEAVTSGNRELTQALSALGSRPTQKQIDEIARRFLGRKDDHAVDEAHVKVARKLDEIISLLKRERRSMETYDQILGQTSQGLSGRQSISKEFLEKIVSVTATATKSSIANREQTVVSITDKSAELQEVRTQLEEYKRLADTDPLTQLNNRRAFDRMVSAIYDSNRNVAFGALVLIDIDRFKSVNDRFGHPVGDRILQIVANIIRAGITHDVFVARTGGEEFALVLNGLGEEAAFNLGDEIRTAIAEAPFVNVGSGANYGPITVSLGICMATQAQDPDDLYIKADRALYASKAAGRNRTTRFSSLSEGNFVKNWLLYRKS